MTRMDMVIALGFAAFCSVFMIWWSDDYAPENIITVSVITLIFGFAWAWVVKRWDYFRSY